MQSINIHVGLNIYLYICVNYMHICFDKFAPLNLHSLRRHRGQHLVLFDASDGQKVNISFEVLEGAYFLSWCFPFVLRMQ